MSSGHAGGATDEADSKYLLEYTQRAALSGVYILLSVLIFIANVWVILAIMFSKRLRCSTTNYLILFLACGGDFFVLFSRIPISVIGFLNVGGWPEVIPEWFCTIMAGIDAGNGINTWMAILLIAINRWVKTCKSQILYRKLFNVWSISVALFFIAWIVKFMFAAFPPLFGFGSYGYSQKYETCSTDDDNASNDFFALVLVTFCYPMQMIFTIYLYVKIFVYVRRETRKGTRIFDSRLLQITRVHFYVAIVNIVLYLPWLVLYVIPGDLSYPYQNYGLIVMTGTCFINPLIYLIWHPDIRDVVGGMFRAVFKCGPNTSNVVV